MPNPEVEAIITEAAARHGIDPTTMITIGELESRLDPGAQNPNSSAGGLFQFIDSTWSEYGGDADRFDAAANADAAGRYLRDVSARLTRALGRQPTPEELYLGHQQGPQGAIRILTNPNANAVDLVGSEAIRLNGGNANMTATQFADNWRNRYNNAAVDAIARVANQGFAPGQAAQEQPRGGNFLGGLFGGARNALSAFSDSTSALTAKFEPDMRSAAISNYLNTPLSESPNSLTPARPHMTSVPDRALQFVMTRPDISRATKDNYDPTEGFKKTVATRANQSISRSIGSLAG